MPNRLVLAIDQGTTGSTALLVDEQLCVRARANVPFINYYPEPGQVEHDATEIFASVASAVRQVIQAAGAKTEQICAIGITNQRETSLFWDRHNGKPIYRALVWQDRRTTPRCRELQELGHESTIRRRTGLVLDPYFSATKACWTLDHVNGARDAAAKGDLAFGTIDTWLAYCLTGEHVTDPSNASRTLLYDLHTGDWEDDLLELFRVPRAVLPNIVDSSGVIGHTKGLDFLPDGIPVAGLIGDQQGALFGQACFKRGMAKCTYGTGAFILLHTGEQPTPSTRGMLSTVAWRIAGQTSYALEGSVFIAGAAVQWLRDGLQIIEASPEVEALAASVPDTAGVVFVPALTGLGAPHWNPEARGIITGLTRGTTRAHIARAAIDGIALSVDDVLRAMAGDLGDPLRSLRVDGGASANNLLMQRQSDLLGITTIRPQVIETTAMGSAMLAGLGVGLWPDLQALAAAWREDARYTPQGDAHEITRTRRQWATTLAKA